MENCQFPCKTRFQSTAPISPHGNWTFITFHISCDKVAGAAYPPWTATASPPQLKSCLLWSPRRVVAEKDRHNSQFMNTIPAYLFTIICTYLPSKSGWKLTSTAIKWFLSKRVSDVKLVKLICRERAKKTSQCLTYNLLEFYFHTTSQCCGAMLVWLAYWKFRSKSIFSLSLTVNLLWEKTISYVRLIRQDWITYIWEPSRCRTSCPFD